jgi:hypothetical protein
LKLAAWSAQQSRRGWKPLRRIMTDQNQNQNQAPIKYNDFDSENHPHPIVRE